jgi:hypothetical protein
MLQEMLLQGFLKQRDGRNANQELQENCPLRHFEDYRYLVVRLLAEQ